MADQQKLAERIKEVLRLDGLRTQGEWIYEHNEQTGNLDLWFGTAIIERENGCYDTAGHINISDCNYGEAGDEEEINNAAFIANSSTHAQIIRELGAEIVALGDSLLALSSLDIKGRALLDRLQFSTEGRELLKMITDSITSSAPIAAVFEGK